MGIHQLMREASVSAKRTMMVGDSDTDVLTGRNAGVWTCGVTYGFGAHTLAECPPDVLLDDLRELPRLLDGKEDG
jgi:phosphoglycolate phosphatase-like HAD superfamily hydrolase